MSKGFRNLTGVFVILTILLFVLFLYFLKYIPEKRSDFHHNAFLELSQVKNALQERNKAYRDAIQNFVFQKNIDSAGLLKFFYYKGENNQSIFSNRTLNGVRDANRFQIGPMELQQDDLSREWQMSYPVYSTNKIPVATFSKNVDTVMLQLVSTYRDIFDSYLLIRDAQIQQNSSLDIKNKPAVPLGLFSDSDAGQKTNPTGRQQGEIIYKSGSLSMDYLVNSDSLMKKKDGFSLLNVIDVNIEGNTYKLFLYPFEIGSERLILAGLISQANYGESYRKIPFNFIALIGVLILLLVIHLPILKIYILSPGERIRDLDIRLIIGSYFIGAFVGFFLFSKVFLDREQSLQNQDHLEMLSNKITDSLENELTTIYQQLKIFDQSFIDLVTRKDPLLGAMTGDTGKQYSRDSLSLDSIFKPRIYPYLDNIFWIDSKGSWLARWAFKKIFTKSPLIQVKDRQYFKDFKSQEALFLSGAVRDSFTIQPTLSKFDGEYIITVAIRSVSVKDAVLSGPIIKNKPFLIGLGAEMHSVARILLPPGYGYSIIDEQGDIKFDSKTGRPLLSNILKDIEDPSRIRQTSRYRSQSYFGMITLRGKKVALLSKPLKGFPYQLLVYYNLERTDGFEEHLIGLSALLTGTILALLIFSALVNQWSKKELRLLRSRSQYFDWIQPSTIKLKRKYYWHLIWGMLVLLFTYILAWIVTESFLPRSEFSLLFISLLFPFYIAVHYYELRERFYDIQENREGINWYFARPTPQLRVFLLIIILLINCYGCVDGFKWSLAMPVFVTQLVWLTVSVFSIVSFKKNKCEDDLVRRQDITKMVLRPYIWAILTGVILISIIPASGIFWLLLKQESSLDFNSDQLTMAKQINQRRLDINHRLPDYKFNLNDSTDLLSIQKIKFNYGIYLLSGQSIRTDTSLKSSHAFYPANEYIQLHRRFFPDDSIILAWAEPPDSAADGTWHFWMDRSDPLHNPQLVFHNQQDGINKNVFRYLGDSSGAMNAAQLMGHNANRAGGLYSIVYFGCLMLSLALAYYLTRSLTKRIFLLDLYKNTKCLEYEHGFVGNLLLQYANRWAIKMLIYKSQNEWKISPIIPDQDVKFIAAYPFPTIKDIYFFEKNFTARCLEERILQMAKLLGPVYSAIWKTLSPKEKFILYDFAIDGFANYKTESTLQDLIKNGLLFYDDLRLSTMTVSFQEYVLQMKDDPDISIFMTKAAREGSWKNFKVPLLLALAAVGIFIFITQDAIYQKITGLLASVTSLLPLVSGLLGRENGKQAEK